MAANQRHIELAKSLPPTLLRFFARHPPAVIASESALMPAADGSKRPQFQPGYEEPFEVTQNSITGRFRNPAVSLRRQADLAKLAKIHGVEELLPVTIKSAEERRKRREQGGLKVKGTGVGQKVRGHWWERTLFARQEMRRQAMRDMPRLIVQWREAAKGKNLRKFTKWPK